jgi:predicted site-specific integrase-resolvase
MNGDELLDTQDLCLLLKASKRTLQRYRKNGVLPFHIIEGKAYYKLSDIHEFIRKSFNPANGNNNPPKTETP